jgi:hypothetical protein
MAKIINGTRVVTNEIRASYVHVAEPQSVNDGDKKYSMSVIIPKSDKDTIDLINKAIDQAITDGITKFGGKRPNKAVLKLPLRDGDVERDDEAYQDAYFINCNNKTAPQVVDAKRRPADPGIIYSGCYCKVSISFFAFSVNGNKGIAAGLGNIQFLRDGEPLGGGHISAADDFGEAEEDDDFLS